MIAYMHTQTQRILEKEKREEFARNCEPCKEILTTTCQTLPPAGARQCDC